MHPPEFVHRELLSGNVARLCEMLKQFGEQVRPSDDQLTAQYAFAKQFLFGVRESLLNLKPNTSLHETLDPYLIVWEDTGYFGIDRAEIAKHITPSD